MEPLLEGMLARASVPQIFKAALKGFENSKPSGIYYFWVSPLDKALIISKCSQLTPSAFSLKLFNICSLQTRYRMEDRQFTGKLIVNSLEGSVTLSFAPDRHS